jgi:hypothetical protein
MKIARLEIESFRGAPDGIYDFSRDGGVAPLTVVAGRPRSGKSGLLAAVVGAKEAAAPSGPPMPTSRALRRGARRGRVEVSWLLDTAEAQEARTSDTLVSTVWTFSDDGFSLDTPAGLRKLLARFSLGDEIAKVELVPEELCSEPKRPLPATSLLRSERSTTRPDKYAWAVTALKETMLAEAIAMRGQLRDQGLLVESEAESDSTSTHYRKAAGVAAPHIRVGLLADLGDGPEPTFHQDGSRDGVGWHALAASDRRTIAFAVAASHLGLSRSLVLWDSADRTFGDRGYAAMVRALQQLCPTAQLVVSLDAPPTELPDARLIRI